MDLLNITSTIVCNTSLPDSEYVASPPPIPPSYLQATAVFVYTLLSLLTVGGNALVCLIVFQYMGTVTVTNLFIVFQLFLSRIIYYLIGHSVHSCANLLHLHNLFLLFALFIH